MGWGISKVQAQKDIKRRSGSEAFDESFDPVQEKVAGLFVEANSLLIREEYDDAAEAFEKVLKLDPKNHASAYQISRIALRRKDFGTGIQYGKKSLALDPDNYWYYRNLYHAYDAHGELDRAEKILATLVDRFPDRYEDQLRLSELYMRMGAAKKAIQQLDKLEKRVGETEEILSRKFHIYIRMREFEPALEAATALTQLSPDNPKYYRQKFEAESQLGRMVDAARSLEELLLVDPNSGFALLALADYYRSIGHDTRSDEYLFKAFNQPGIEAESKVQVLNNLFAYLERDPALMSRILQLTAILKEVHPDHPGVLLIVADFFVRDGSLDSARQYYRKSLELEPANINGWSKLLLVSSELGDFEALYTDAEEAISYFPNMEEYLFFYGVAASYTERWREAEYALNKIIRKGSADISLLAQAQAELGSVYSQQEKYKDSEAAFTEALRLMPEDPYLLNSYAYSLAIRGAELDRAEGMAKKALKQEPHHPAYMDTYGWILFQKGDFVEAEKWLGRAAEASNSAEILEHYGDVLSKLGRLEEARVFWQRALDVGGNFDLDQKQLGQ